MPVRAMWGAEVSVGLTSTPIETHMPSPKSKTHALCRCSSRGRICRAACPAGCTDSGGGSSTSRSSSGGSGNSSASGGGSSSSSAHQQQQ
jgi:hypothetical protein